MKSSKIDKYFLTSSSDIENDLLSSKLLDKSLQRYILKTGTSSDLLNSINFISATKMVISFRLRSKRKLKPMNIVGIHGKQNAKMVQQVKERHNVKKNDFKVQRASDFRVQRAI